MEGPRGSRTIIPRPPGDPLHPPETISLLRHLRWPHPDVIRSQHLRVLDLRVDPDPLQPALSLRDSRKLQEVLVVQVVGQPVQVRLEAHQLRRTHREALPARLVRNLSQPTQRQLQVPLTPPGASYANPVDRVDDHVVALADLAGRRCIYADL